MVIMVYGVVVVLAVVVLVVGLVYHLLRPSRRRWHR